MGKPLPEPALLERTTYRISYLIGRTKRFFSKTLGAMLIRWSLTIGFTTTIVSIKERIN